MSYKRQSSMTTIVIAVFTLALATSAFAGRAFPVSSERFVVDLFSDVNPNLKWDISNFLVDLSGWYAVCKNVDVNGVLDVKELTPEGSPVNGVVAAYPGDASDADTVNGYIKETMPQWLTNPIYSNQIAGSDKFGCSVQPKCQGKYVIACLFNGNGKSDFDFNNQIEDNNFEEFKAPDVSQITAPIHVGEPKALAFTPEQYAVAEGILEETWDRSHFLENLSGQETDCGMVTNKDWKFDIAKDMCDERQMDIETFYGVTENEGETEPAMVKILKTWAGFNTRSESDIGCSIIPDCMSRGKMFVVVSCIKSFGRGGKSNVGEVKAPEPSFITLPATTEPKAYAFTKDQYKVAEEVFGRTWDSSHFLENLSGKETDCEMLRKETWDFPEVKAEANDKGVTMETQFGVTKKNGDTDEAITEILKNMATPGVSGKVGCSVMPDCKEARGIFTVVSCIFSE